MCLGLFTAGAVLAEDAEPATRAEPVPRPLIVTVPAEAPAATERAAEPDAPADAEKPADEDEVDITTEAKKPPEPLSDEEVALIVEDELEAILLEWINLSKSANVNLVTGQISRNMSFSAYVTLPNDTRVMGVGSQIIFTSAVNGEGEEVMPNRMDIVAAFGKPGAPPALPNTTYYPPQRDSSRPSPYRQVSGNIQNMDTDAKSFKSLTGFVPIQIAAQVVAIDIPLEKTAAFTPLFGELRYHMLEINHTNSYSDITVHFTRDGQDANQSMRMDREPSVIRIEVLDTYGEVMPQSNLSTSNSSININNQRHYTLYMRPRVNKVAGQTPTTLRLHVATRMATAALPFVFEDVPLP